MHADARGDRLEPGTQLGAPTPDDLDVVPLQRRLTLVGATVERGRELATVIGPREDPGRGLAQVIADDEIADPSDRDPESQRRRQRVGDLEEPEAEPSDVDGVRDRGSRDASEEGDPTLPDVEPLEG